MTPNDDMTGARDDGQQSVRRTAANVAAKGKNFAKRQKNSAAEELQVVGDALCRVADEMQDNEEAALVHLAGRTGEQLRSLGQQLREKDVPALMREARDYARRSPGTFFAGTMAAGFLLTRFMKSSQGPDSAPRRNAPDDDSRRDLPVVRDDPSLQGERYAH